MKAPVIREILIEIHALYIYFMRIICCKNKRDCPFI